jgi:cytochrome P450
MTLHQNTVKETLRLYNPVHSILRQVKRSLVIDGRPSSCDSAIPSRPRESGQQLARRRVLPEPDEMGPAPVVEKLLRRPRNCR